MRWSQVLTISRLSRWSINYYNDTARQANQAGMDRQRANGGLGEYYSESDTRAPTWLIAGDTARTAELVGLDGRAADGGSADPEVVGRWLDDGIACRFSLPSSTPMGYQTKSRSTVSQRWPAWLHRGGDDGGYAGAPSGRGVD
jgi:hypothetical protein